jgi:hypothetical protein
MPQIYTFNAELLSAAKLLTPTTNASLSADGVNTISLSSDVAGIAYNPNSSPSGVLISTTVEGNVFRIDRIYDGSQMALIYTSPARTYTIFQFASAGAIGVALSSAYVDVSIPTRRRRRHLGYA